MAKESVFDFLNERGLIYQSTNMEGLKEKLDGEPFTFYLGIDPTADSIHLGHFCSLMTFKRLQEAGHKGILLIGGATAQVGDPSGRQDLRKMISEDEIQKNFTGVKELCTKYIQMDGNNPAIVVNNRDWMKNYSYVDFLTNVCKYFNINTMLTADMYKNRLEQGGLTMMEIGYMPIQANDFQHLHKEYNVTMEIGGSDQWGNIIAGVELMRKQGNTNCMAFTTPLLLNSEGKKMGKSAKGAVWIAEEKFSVYDFYQYFINIADSDVHTLLKWFTNIPLKEIEDMCDKNIINAKKFMAYELTKLVHGDAKAKEVQQTSEEVFSKGIISNNMPTFEITRTAIQSLNICDLCVDAKLCTSKSEARRLIEQGGISVDDEKVTDWNMILNKDTDFIIKKGKKVYLKISIV